MMMMIYRLVQRIL